MDDCEIEMMLNDTAELLVVIAFAMRETDVRITIHNSTHVPITVVMRGRFQCLTRMRVNIEGVGLGGRFLPFLK
jgi:hypothetical protein